MKLIGIDYGEKRVGVAVSDERGLMAFPHVVLPNNRDLVSAVGEIITAQNSEAIVVGESKARDGGDNPIMAGTRQFADTLHRSTNLPVHFEPEFYSSQEARLLKAQGVHAGGTVDAEAAAVILNSYLTRMRNKKSAYNKPEEND